MINNIIEHHSNTNIIRRIATASAQNKHCNLKNRNKNSFKDNRKITTRQPEQEIHIIRQNKPLKNTNASKTKPRLQRKLNKSNER